jgi:hypothetical protein
MTQYFVRPSVATDDLGAGTYADPWQTLGKAASFAYSPGDYVFVEGGTYREGNQWQTGGTLGSPVRIRPFELGGAAPIIKGSEIASGWVDGGSNRWHAGTGVDPNQAFVDGVRGTEVFSAAAVVAPGQWFYDSGLLAIWVYSEGGAPTETWEYSLRTYCVWLDDNYFDIQGFELMHSRQEGVVLPSTGTIGCAVRDMHIHDNWQHGVLVDDNSQDTLISGGTIEDNLDGINVDNATDVTIEDVTIRRTIQDNGSGIAVSNSSGTTIRNCTISDYPSSGGSENGIELAAATNISVSNCTVTSCRALMNLTSACSGTISGNNFGGGVGVDTSGLGLILRTGAGQTLTVNANDLDADFGTYALGLEAITATGLITLTNNDIAGAALTVSVAAAEASNPRTVSGNSHSTTAASDIINDGTQTITKANYGLWKEQHPEELVT